MEHDIPILAHLVFCYVGTSMNILSLSLIFWLNRSILSLYICSCNIFCSEETGSSSLMNLLDCHILWGDISPNHVGHTRLKARCSWWLCNSDLGCLILDFTSGGAFSSLWALTLFMIILTHLCRTTFQYTKLLEPFVTWCIFTDRISSLGRWLCATFILRNLNNG